MNKYSKQKTIIIVVIGLVSVLFSQIIYQFLEISDFVKGALTGGGIALLLMSLAFGSLRTSK